MHATSPSSTFPTLQASPPPTSRNAVLIAIGTNPDRAHWAHDSSASIGREHIVVSNYGYELAKLGWLMTHTTADRFLFLQDSWVVKTPDFFDLLTEHTGSLALLSDPYYFGCYAGIYERKVIEEIGVPTISLKFDAVQAERSWHESYVQISGEPPVLFPELRDDTATEVRHHHGRDNLILENDYIIKYKGTWRADQLSPTL